MTSPIDMKQAEHSGLGDDAEGNSQSLPPTRNEYLWLVAIIFTYLAVAAALIAQGTPLGHDESVYALRARHLEQDAPPIFYWNSYRAPGLPFLLQLAWIGPATEPYLRVIVAAFGPVLIVSTWLIGRTLLTVRIGLIAAAGVMFIPAVLDASTRVWPDLPGAAVGLAAIAVFTWSIERDEPSRWMLMVPLLTFIATLLRFGAPVPIAIGLASVAVLRWRSVMSAKWLVGLTAALTLLAVSAVLFVPWVTGWAQMGDAISPFSADRELRSDSPVGFLDTIVGYTRFRRNLVGGLAGAALLTGLAAGFAVHKRSARTREAFWFSIGVAAVTGLVVAAIIHAEPRYLIPVYPWLWIGAAVGIDSLTPTGQRRLTATTAAVVAVLMLGSSYGLASANNNLDKFRFTAIEQAARTIDERTEDGQCSVLSTYVPQVGWYSKCPTNRIEASRVVLSHETFPEGYRYLMLVEGGKRQPEGDVLDAYLEATTDLEFTVGDPALGRLRYVQVYRLD